MDMTAIEIKKPKKEKPKIHVHLSIPKEHPLHKHFKLHGLKVGHSHKIGLSGKVHSLREDDMGKELGLEVDGIDGISDKKHNPVEDWKKEKHGKSAEEIMEE